jgi:hypothetical protein
VCEQPTPPYGASHRPDWVIFDRAANATRRPQRSVTCVRRLLSRTPSGCGSRHPCLARMPTGRLSALARRESRDSASRGTALKRCVSWSAGCQEAEGGVCALPRPADLTPVLTVVPVAVASPAVGAGANVYLSIARTRARERSWPNEARRQTPPHRHDGSDRAWSRASASRASSAREKSQSRQLADFLSQCELDGLVPRHGSSFVEGSAGSRLAEPGAGWNEVALAPRLG